MNVDVPFSFSNTLKGNLDVHLVYSTRYFLNPSKTLENFKFLTEHNVGWIIGAWGQLNLRYEMGAFVTN